MVLAPNVRAEIARLEARRPDPEQDPHGFKNINDEITKKIDAARLWANSSKQTRSVV